MKILFIVNKKYDINGELIKGLSESGHSASVAYDNTEIKNLTEQVKTANAVCLVGVCPRGKKIAKRFQKSCCAVFPKVEAKKSGFLHIRLTVRFYKKFKSICCENVCDGYKLIKHCKKSRIFIIPCITGTDTLTHTPHELAQRLCNAATY